MPYIDGYVLAVPEQNKDAYLELANLSAVVFKEHGAISVAECWGNEVPDGEHTSFPMAVKLKDNETVVFSWIVWPDKATRETGMKTAMEDPRFKPFQEAIPFDGKRMIMGGFDAVVWD